MAVRQDGNWEGWIRFFLHGVAETAKEAASTARAIVKLRDEHQQMVYANGLGTNGAHLLKVLYQRPLVNSALVASHLNINYTTASRLIRQFERVGILDEITGRRRNRIFRYTPYWRLFQDADDIDKTSEPAQTTASS